MSIMTNGEISAILNKAADILESKEFYKDYFVDEMVDDPKAICTTTALAMAILGHRLTRLSDAVTLAENPAFDHFMSSQSIEKYPPRLDTHYFFAPNAEIEALQKIDGVCAWNNVEGRTKEQVLQAFRNAANSN